MREFRRQLAGRRPRGHVSEQGRVATAVVYVIASLSGLRDEPTVDFIVRDLRLSTALAGLGVGLALGVSGLLFQKLLGNPLASPDFVGVSSGASLFAVCSIVLLGASSTVISGAALLGALLSAVLGWSAPSGSPGPGERRILLVSVVVLIPRSAAWC